MYFKYRYKIHFQNVFQIQNTYMYFKYVFQILVFEILPSTDAGWSHLIWHNFIRVGVN